MIRRERVIQSVGNILRRAPLLSHRTEQIDHHSHRHRGWHTPATDITHTEVETVVLHKEVIEVATHLLGRFHHGIEIDIVTLRKSRELARHHSHLDVAGNAQLAIDTFLGSRGVLQLVVGLTQLL